jgi:hypothetical protein
MTQKPSAWLAPATGPADPTLLPVCVEPSPPGSDATASLIGIAVFNGLCRLLTALADRKMLVADELQGIEDAMTTPLDDAEWRDNEVISSFRGTATEVLAAALARV